MSRKQSREVAYRLLFQLCFNKGDDIDGSVFSDNAERFHLDAINSAVTEFGVTADEREITYIDNLCNAVTNNMSQIDAAIAQYAKGFAFNRIFHADLTALRMAIAELKYTTNSDVPAPVVISEAVNIAKKYGTEKSGGFVNGILASVLANKN
jgi:N utilization substance protein B